ncbi:putative disease resistance protein [Trichinella pseudospiralis]
MFAQSAKWRGEQEEAEQSGRSTGSLWTRVDWTSCGAGQQRAKRAESRAGSGRGQKVTTNTPTPAFTLVQSRLCGRLVSVDLSTKKTMTTTKSVHCLPAGDHCPVDLFTRD